ncbi:diphosphonucleotide phosphatase2 [Zea mays]|uniref:Diphosphonucleotide phosphatase2 n=1 Tax=Zea mays TaxID=4577 RepID=A0A1D6ND77_MAIZE|nr:diphosphonucleotide phosphatase2 [Zea mays]
MARAAAVFAGAGCSCVRRRLLVLVRRRLLVPVQRQLCGTGGQLCGLRAGGRLCACADWDCSSCLSVLNPRSPRSKLQPTNSLAPKVHLQSCLNWLSHV